MKKFFLLIAAGLIVGNVGAQENTSTVFTGSDRLTNNNVAKAHPRAIATHSGRFTNANKSAAKTTASTYNDWFDYWDQNASTSSAGYYFNEAPDSNIVADGSNIFFHGMGMSFDPTDINYYALAVTTQITDPQMSDLDSYAVDSFVVFGKYLRNDNTVTDSLIVELFATTIGVDSGTYKLQFAASADGLSITADSTPRFAAVNYTGATNDCWAGITSTQMQRYAFALDATSVGDTDANGVNTHLFALSSPLKAGPGQKIVSFVHFKGATTYPLGTLASAANYYHLFAGDPDGAGTFPQQPPHDATSGYTGSYQCGLQASNQNRYSDTSFAYMGHSLLIPSVAFTTAPGFDVPEQAFHVVYTPSTTGVANVKTVTKSVAFPNPATNELVVAFGTSTAANVTVTLANTVGQTVSTQTLTNTVNGKVTFNVANLADGVYFYTINANGERTTNRVVVAH